jgi:hypothetical protein
MRLPLVGILLLGLIMKLSLLLRQELKAEYHLDMAVLRYRLQAQRMGGKSVYRKITQFYLCCSKTDLV